MRITSGRFKGQSIASPKTDAVRPTQEQVRAAVFNICRDLVENADILDLFAGSGAIGFEALSRGARFATFVEHHLNAFQTIKKTCSNLNVEAQCAILFQDAFKALKAFALKQKQFSIIYLDPPYTKDSEISLGEKALQMIDEYKLLQAGGVLFLEDKSKHHQEKKLSYLYLKSSRRFGSMLLEEYVPKRVEDLV